MTHQEDRFERHAAQRQFMANLYNAGSGLLNSLQTTETTQSVNKESQAQHTILFKWNEQRQSVPVAARAPALAATTAPRIQIRSHPTQSDLVQRFAAVFTPFMSTSTAACQADFFQPAEVKKAPEPTKTWGQWFK